MTLQTTPGGALIDALVFVSEARTKAIIAAGQTVPNPVPVRALIDTGASCTCIDPAVLTQLALTPTGNVKITTPSTGTVAQTKNQFDVGFAIVDTQGGYPFINMTLPVVESELFAPQGIHVLIGRDILSQCLLHYDGKNNLFSLAY